MIKSETIRKKVAKLKAKLNKAQAALDDFCETCPHPNLTYLNQGSTGNWDRDDYYWRSWHCHDCGKRWTTDQTYESKQKYPHAIDTTYMSYNEKQLLEKLKGIRID